MKKTWIILILTALIIIIAVFLFLPKKEIKEINKACFSNYCFDVEIAKTESERERGLMFREKLDRNRGMLFIFPEESIYSFWMKNTLISLDMIWINSNQEIVFINENSQPCKENNCSSITPDKKAKYILEINAGISKEIGLKMGDKIELKY